MVLNTDILFLKLRFIFLVPATLQTPGGLLDIPFGYVSSQIWHFKTNFWSVSPGRVLPQSLLFSRCLGATQLKSPQTFPAWLTFLTRKPVSSAFTCGWSLTYDVAKVTHIQLNPYIEFWNLTFSQLAMHGTRSSIDAGHQRVTAPSGLAIHHRGGGGGTMNTLQWTVLLH